MNGEKEESSWKSQNCYSSLRTRELHLDSLYTLSAKVSDRYTGRVKKNYIETLTTEK